MVRALLRTMHILGGGVLIGAFLFGQDAGVVHQWLVVTALSGVLLLATDLHASAAILFEVRGLAVVVKLLLLSLLGVLPGYEVSLLVAILSLGAVSSHLSRDVRHRLWLRLPGVNPDQRHG